MTPRVRTISKGKLEGAYRYKGHDIDVSRKNRRDDWYIQVRASNGCFSYDGWWNDSADRTQREAVLEAIRGACINP